MSTEARDSFSGLVTNIAETKAPGSALRLADNVVIRKPGSLEPRQAYAPKTVAYSLAGLSVRNAQAHGAEMVYEISTGWKSSGGTTRLYDPSPGVTNQTVSKFRADSFSTVLSRGNHYVPHLNGTVAATSAADTHYSNAGLSVSVAISSAATVGAPIVAGNGLATAFQWAYRLVCKRTDVNGLVVRSRPTGSIAARNTAGSNQRVSILIQIAAAWVDSPTQVEVYRTRAFPNAVLPDDEFALVGEVVLTGSSATFVDEAPDSKRGALLYTSPSQYGIESANDRPPAAFCTESYRGCVFWGNTVGPQRFVVSTKSIDASGLAAGVGSRGITFDMVNGSAVITNVTPVTGIQPGMWIFRVGYNNFTGLPQANYVVSVVGTTVTMNAPTPYPTQVGAVGFAFDAIEVDGVWHPLLNPGNATTTLTREAFTPYLTSTNPRFQAYTVTPPNYGSDFTFVVERLMRNTSTFTMRATHGDEMTPPLPLYGATAATSSIDAYPNAVQWSKPDQPEHVPPANYALIAEKTKAVLGMASTRDSLFIFKEDGIWRLSGIGGQWSIDPFDLTTFCILPSSIRKLNNRIYLLTNKGVVTVSEQGVEQISFPIADVVKALVDDIRANYASLGYYKISGVDGVAATVDDRNSEYQLLLGTVAHELGAADMLVYNETSGAWTTFSFQAAGTNGFTPAGLGIAEEGSPLILHSAGVKQAAYTTETTLSQTTRIKYDGAATSTTGVTSVDNGDDTADVTFGSAVTCVVGYDVLCTSAGDYPIIAVTDTTHVTVQLNGQSVPVFGATVRRGYPCTVQPHGFLNTIVMGKFWEDASVGFSRLLGPVSLSVDYSSAQPAVAESSQTISQPIELQRAQGIAPYHLGTLLGANVPTDHARSWLLRAKLIWLMVRGSVSLELVALSARDTAKNKPQLNSTGI